MRSLLVVLVFAAACGNTAASTDDIAGDDVAVDASADVDGTPAGCPSGTTPGTANGHAVCRTSTGIPRLDHVFVIEMENTSWSTLEPSDNTPYLHGLFTTGAVSSDYHGVEHPSLANYIALMSGDTGGIGCDCDPEGSACNTLTCNLLIHSCGCPQAGTHLGDQLDAAHLTWRAYAEDMGTPCNMTSAGNYAARHMPFVYFTSMQDDQASCAAHVVDYDLEFPDDLAAGPSAFTFIAPNLVNDMHDPFPAGAQNLANGDAWLAVEAQRILDSAAYQDHGLLVIVWDEDDLSGVGAPDDPIPMIVMSPLGKTGYVSTRHADHYDLLATIEDALGVPRLGAAAQAMPLADFFAAQ